MAPAGAPTAPDAARVAVLDVNGTLSDLAPLAGRFSDVGAPEACAAAWFDAVLRDGFALTAAGTCVPFAVVAESVLRTVLHGAGVLTRTDEAVQHVLAGFADLGVHPDVADGVRGLRAQGLRLVALTNGDAAAAGALLERAGVREEFEVVLSAEEAGAWKPATRAYEHAAARCGAAPPECLLVAVHPWDVDGAARAGMLTAWIDRTGAPYPAHMRRADVVAGGLGDLAQRLVAVGWARAPASCADR